MKKITASDLLVLILVLVFAFDLNFKSMNTIHWIGLVASLLWVFTFVAKLLLKKDD